jgi:FixJ family two-component response regulator
MFGLFFLAIVAAMSFKLIADVANHLGIAEKTVKVHRSRVVEKMPACSAVDLGQLCSAAGIKPAPL